jgi:hypothetical protein
MSTLSNLVIPNRSGAKRVQGSICGFIITDNEKQLADVDHAFRIFLSLMH